MGNEASRPVGDGLSPQGGISGRIGGSPQMPPTPTFTPTAGAGRRSKSFTGFQSPASPSTATASGGTTTSAANLQKQQSMPRMERTIQRMDKAIRRRVRGGITYNMKIVIRGEKGTGKTSLFQRLKGEPIPDEHASTPQLQSATINWNFRANSEENVKCEVWDVVDRGFNLLVEGSEAGANGADSAGHSGSPFELGALQANGGSFASVRASAAVAASIAGAAGVNGAHTVATVDASTVDVYHETHGVIFLLDITKWHTLEYVKKELEKVPVHIPTLVLGNFRDCGNQRKIFKEDIQDLLYGSSDRSWQQGRRPHELLYFECSLLNCYGLKSLHQYFGVPFLQLKLATIRQQMRIVEGEFSHLKHDLTAKISGQRYSDYVEHIKATGSDIRTGRKVSGTAATGLVRMESTAIVVNGSERSLRAESDDSQDAHAKLGRTQSNASTGSDIVVTEQSVASSNRVDAVNGSVLSPSELSLSQSKDLEDLPERMNSLADQVTVPLKIAHAESAPVGPKPVDREDERPAVPKKTNTSAESSSKKSTTSKETTAKTVDEAPVRTAQKGAVDEPMSLEDFQVPKLKKNDLDSFYSDEDSDADGASDEDVIVPPAAGAMKKYASHSHKQMFIDSDASDSDEEVKSWRKAKKSSPRKRDAVAQSVNESSVTKSSSASENDAEAARDAASVAGVETKAFTPGKHADEHPSTDESRPEHHQPQPPPSPSTTASSSRPVSPLQRTSRSPSPRQKLDSSRSNSPKLGHSPVLATDDTAEARTRGTGVEELHVTEDTASLDRESIAEKGALVNNAPESPSGRNSPRRHLQRKESSQSNSSRKNSFEAESAAEVSTEVAILTETVNTGVLDEQTHEEVETASDGVVSETTANEVNTSTDEAAVENEEKYSSSRISEELKYEEEAKHAVFSDDIEDFFSDKDGGDKDDAVEVASSQVENERRPGEASMESEAKCPDVVVSDDEADEPKLNGASAADKAGDDVHDLIVGSSMDNDNFFSGESDAEDEEKQEVENQAPISIPSVVSAQSKTAQQSSRPSMLMSDEESGDNHAQITARNNPGALATAAPFKSPSGLEIAMNGGESSDLDGERHVQKARAILVFSSQSNNKLKEASTSYASAPAEAGFAPAASKNELDSFFSESESESEVARKSESARNLYPTPLSRAKPSTGPSRHSLVASDDDDDEDGNTIDRFASYDRKTARKSKAERKQEREEIRRMTASLSSSALIEDATPAPTTLASIGNADVMAAIRQAQKEALRMMPASETAGGGEEEDKKRTSKSKSKSSSSSSHRRSSKTHGEHLAASSSSSSAAKKKKSSKSSSRSKREAGSGDERRILSIFRRRAREAPADTPRAPASTSAICCSWCPSCRAALGGAAAADEEATTRLKANDRVESCFEARAQNRRLIQEVQEMQHRVLELQRQRDLLQSEMLDSYENAIAYAMDMTRNFYTLFENGYDPVKTPAHAQAAARFLRAIMDEDVVCTEFRGVNMFLHQYEVCCQGHASMKVALKGLTLISDGAIQIYAHAVATFRISRETLIRFFPRITNDEELTQELTGREYMLQYDKVFHFQDGHIFQHESRVDLCTGMLDLVKDPFVAMKLLEASLMTKHGHLKIDHRIEEDQYSLANQVFPTCSNDERDHAVESAGEHAELPDAPEDHAVRLQLVGVRKRVRDARGRECSHECAVGGFVAADEHGAEEHGEADGDRLEVVLHDALPAVVDGARQLELLRVLAALVGGREPVRLVRELARLVERVVLGRPRARGEGLAALDRHGREELDEERRGAGRERLECRVERHERHRDAARDEGRKEGREEGMQWFVPHSDVDLHYRTANSQDNARDGRVAERQGVRAVRERAVRQGGADRVDPGRQDVRGRQPPTRGREALARQALPGVKQTYGAVPTEEELDNKRLVRAREAEYRWKRIVMNDLENIPLGLIVFGAGVLVEANEKVHIGAMLVFTLARLLHTYVYAYSMQPHRGLTWMIAILAVLVGIGNTVITGVLDN